MILYIILLLTQSVIAELDDCFSKIKTLKHRMQVLKDEYKHVIREQDAKLRRAHLSSYLGNVSRATKSGKRIFILS